MAGRSAGALMDGVKRPNRLAWVRSILDQYEVSLTRYATRITGDGESARDVVQETFLRLCSEDPAQVDGYLAQWLFTVCRRCALDVRRKEGRMRALTETKAEAYESPNRDPAIAAEDREGTSRVLRMIGGLPDNQQEVIRLRFQNGLSYKEIAAVTNLSVSNVGYLIHTAIRNLRHKLNIGTV